MADDTKLFILEATSTTCVVSTLSQRVYLVLQEVIATYTEPINGREPLS